MTVRINPLAGHLDGPIHTRQIAARGRGRV
jgi:hypothetical protein